MLKTSWAPNTVYSWKPWKLEYAASLRAAITTTLLFFVSATFKTQRGTHTSSKQFFSRLTCTSQRHKLVSAKKFSMFSGKTSDVFTSYVAWGHEKATLNPIWPVRLKRISRNLIWIGFQITYECSLKWICTNQILRSSLLFRLFKYDRISIGFGLTVWTRLKTTVPSKLRTRAAVQRNNERRTRKDELEQPFDWILVRIERKKIIAMLR